MAIKHIPCDIDVVTAARSRIQNVFDSGLPIFLAFSCGKDSLCMSHLVLSMINEGKINPEQLTVQFIDEEGLYPSMVEAAERWRKNFLLAGAKFEWYCLPFKQMSIIDHLSAQESWITWEPGKEAVWMREVPPYAITSHPFVKYPGYCTYQVFCDHASRKGIALIGIRTAESLQRLQMVSTRKRGEYSQGNNKEYPIYDWKDSDVWLYIKENNLIFPEVYMHLYEAGVSKRQLRLCCFFAESSIQGLRWVSQVDPVLWEKIERRYPNAYLVLLYWDSEMFQRSTASRKKMEESVAAIDYQKEVDKLLYDPQYRDRIRHMKDDRFRDYRRFVLESRHLFNENMWKKIYESLLSGDPKGRTIRSLYFTSVKSAVTDHEKKKARINNG